MKEAILGINSDGNYVGIAPLHLTNSNNGNINWPQCLCLRCCQA